jgi:predicted metalloprotease with PDZ domain
MIRFSFLSLVLCALNAIAFGAKISYTLKMPRPQNHYFQVEMQVEQLKQKTATVKLPVWAPGSYLVREFSRHLNQVKAYSLQGAALPIIKKTKNAWEIDLKGLCV